MIEFIEQSHTYLNEFGIIIPSVTQLISWKLGSGYDDVPKEVLERKALYGTRIHEIIESFHNGADIAKTPIEKASLMAYKSLAAKLPKVIANEQLVCYDNRLAGTIDIVYEDGTLGDIKTYAQVDEHALLKLKWQLSLYMLCKEGKDMDKKLSNHHMIHIPKNMKYGLYTTDIFSFNECISLLEEYEKANS